MSNELQFHQEQINKLQISLAAQEILTRQALDAMGENQKMLKALHQRLDGIEEELKDIDSKTLTREERASELEEIINAKVGSWVIKGVWTLIIGAGATAVAWFRGAL